jgi:acetyl-CoA C-acetyltransferase
MAIDPRTPVLVGAGQLLQRVAPEDALEPVGIMAESARLAAEDAGAPGLLAKVDSIRVVGLVSWRYADPGALVAERIGATPRQSGLTPMGGNAPQTLVSSTATDILAGKLDVALLTAAESARARAGYRKRDEKPPWTTQPEGTPPAEQLGKDVPMNHQAELAKGIFLPLELYPIFECALRAAAGRTVDEQVARISELWSRFSEVAAANPYAWSREALTPGQIATPTAENRMIGFPYTRSMNTNNTVDMGASVLLCSVEAARAAGVPEDRWVFPWSGTDAHDHPAVSSRADLHSSPAMRLAGGRALELAGVGVDDLAHVDLYSCFPAAVQIAAAELGLSLERQLTVTGGLSFAGAPLNGYVMHSIATMADVLRADPGSRGLISANGGYVTKHAFGVWSTEPPPQAFRWEDVQPAVDALPSTTPVEEHEGPVTVEAYTVMHDRDNQAEKAILACRTPDGGRTWGLSQDEDLMAAMKVEELVGQPGQLKGTGKETTFTLG